MGLVMKRATETDILASVSAYWCHKRGSDFAPPRARINPIEIARYLPHVQFVTRESDGEFRYGLTGEAIVAGYGYNPSGKRFSDILQEPRLSIARRHYERVWVERRPTTSRNKYETPNGEQKIATRIIMPLSEDGRHVTSVFVSQIFEYSSQFFAFRGIDWMIDDELDEFEYFQCAHGAS